MILQLGDLAKHVLRVRDPGSVKDAYHVLLGMAALNGAGKLPKPALLSIMSHEVPMKKVCIVHLPPTVQAGVLSSISYHLAPED